MRSLPSAIAFSILLLGCGPKPASSLLRLEVEKSGDNCAHGGVALQNGIDENNDQVLADDEIDDTKYVCHGESKATVADAEESPPNEESPTYEESIKLAKAAMTNEDHRDYAAGLAHCKKALESVPDDQTAIMTCAIAACNLGDGTIAKAYIERMMSNGRKAGVRQICMRLNVEGFEPN